MNIVTLNGNMYIEGEHYYFDELEVQIEEFEDEVCDEEYEYEECDSNCDECCECEENFEEMLSDYANIIAENCCCTDCIKDVLGAMLCEIFEEYREE